MPSDLEDGSDSYGSEEEGDFEDMAADALESSPKLGDSSEGDSEGKTIKKPTDKANAKDPNRPKRKKAKRACFACQRAHLTCGKLVLNDTRLSQLCLTRVQEMNGHV